MSYQKLHDAIKQVNNQILGKSHQVRLAITSLLAGGHLLIEDIPGVGKTSLAQVISRSLGLDFNRVQFTSDLLPADILGATIYERALEKFTFHPGPIFSQVVLADEINRATPKTQSALLEAMEEYQVSIEGKSYHLPEPFFVIATQNPTDQIGTFPLPESQLDRFLMVVTIGYPERNAERELLNHHQQRVAMDKLLPKMSSEELIDLQKEVQKVKTSEALVEYVLQLIEFSRTSNLYKVGLSPRAGLAVLSAAKAWAFIDGRQFVRPDDVQAILPSVASHRLKSITQQSFSESHTNVSPLLEVPIP